MRNNQKHSTAPHRQRRTTAKTALYDEAQAPTYANEGDRAVITEKTQAGIYQADDPNDSIS